VDASWTILRTRCRKTRFFHHDSIGRCPGQRPSGIGSCYAFESNIVGSLLNLRAEGENQFLDPVVVAKVSYMFRL